ncbi:MAG TPA: isoprenylcysteine carboxylmethyltransferase family protein [Planctomycetota bacterium]
MSAALLALELVVGLTALQRLAELVLSRRNLARLSVASRAADSRANYGALVALQSLWLVGCALEPALRGAAAPAPLLAAGLALFAAGAALRLWCIRTLGTWWNARARVDPGLRVVAEGPYRFVRHPNYLGVLLELVGLPLAGGAWWTLLLLAPPHALVLGRRIRGEDALLFGLPGYAERMAGKGALLPRLARR